MRPTTNGRPLTILVPLAGAESRHVARGLAALPQLTVVGTDTVLQHAIRNAGFSGRYVFVVRADHYARYNLGYLLHLIVPRADILSVERPTEGALCSALAAADHLDANDPLIVMHSDQLLNWDCQHFLQECNQRQVDGAIVTCVPHEPGWRYNYVRVDAEQAVVEIAAKKAISPLATAGIFYWRRAQDFLHFGRQVLVKRLHSNGVFHLVSAFGPALCDHRSVFAYNTAPIIDLSTPEGISTYAANWPAARRTG